MTRADNLEESKNERVGCCEVKVGKLENVGRGKLRGGLGRSLIRSWILLCKESSGDCPPASNSHSSKFGVGVVNFIRWQESELDEESVDGDN